MEVYAAIFNKKKGRVSIPNTIASHFQISAFQGELCQISERYPQNILTMEYIAGTRNKKMIDS